MPTGRDTVRDRVDQKRGTCGRRKPVDDPVETGRQGRRDGHAVRRQGAGKTSTHYRISEHGRSSRARSSSRSATTPSHSCPGVRRGRGSLTYSLRCACRMSIDRKTGWVRWVTSPGTPGRSRLRSSCRWIGGESTARFTVTVTEQPSTGAITSAGTRDREVGKKHERGGRRVLSPRGFRCPPDPLLGHPVSGDGSDDRPHREGPLHLLECARVHRPCQEGIDRLSRFPGTNFAPRILTASRRARKGCLRLLPPCGVGRDSVTVQGRFFTGSGK